MRAFDGSLICPIHVGRTAHLETLLRLAEQAWAGRGRVAVLVGEAGIGKSRLIAEVRARLQARQAARAPAALMLRGNCFEPDRLLPYAPLLDLLRGFLSSCPPEKVAAYLGPVGPELGRLLPEIGDLSPRSSPDPARGSEQDRRRLHRDLSQVFTRLARRHPLLLVVEDLHWSDDASLDFLLHLARHIDTLPILLLLTYRGDEVQTGLDRFIGALERERLAAECALARLSMGEVDAMVRAIFELERPVRSEFLEALYALAEGNPFFTEEILKALVTAGDIFFEAGAWDRKPLDELRIPRSVHAAVQRRLDGLSPAARQLLDLAAVTGRRFDFDLLQQVTHQDDASLLHLVKQLIAAQLVVEESANTFAFRHALTRQAVYASLLARERRALHRAIGEAMELVYVGALEAHLADLASHYSAAGVWPKAMEYAQRAGERAQALYAPRAAIEHFTQALEAARHLTLDPPPLLHRQRGQAYEVVGDFEGTHQDYQRSLDAARRTPDRAAEWQCLFDLGFLWVGRDYQRAGVYFHQALELARLIGEPSTLARSLRGLGYWHVEADQPLEGLRCHEEALRIVEALGDRRGEAETLDSVGLASHFSGDLCAAARYYERAAAIYREMDDREGLVTALTMLAARGVHYLHSPLVWPAASLAEAKRAGDQSLKIARSIGWRAGESFALAYLAGALGPWGDYARALVDAQAALNIAEEIEHRQWLIVAHRILGALHLDLLALPEAQRHLEKGLEVAEGVGALYSIRVTAALLGEVYVAQRDYARAASVLDAALGAEAPSQTLPQRLIWCARAELALARDDGEAALQIVDRLILSAANAEVGQEAIIPTLWLLRGRALAAIGRWDEAEQAIAGARGVASKLGLRPLLWRLDASLATVYRAQGRRDQAAAAVSAANTAVAALGATLTDATLRETFLAGAATHIPRIPPTTPRRAAKQAYAGLTEREREVAALVALGKSNRALAETLVVSERTAAKHVENILSKLGFSRRSQVAAWAVEKGLATRANRTIRQPRKSEPADRQ